MRIKAERSTLNGSIAVSGSKSHSIRAVAAALISDGKCTLRDMLASGDTLAVLKAAEQLGARVSRNGSTWEVTGTGGKFKDSGRTIDMQNSGTGLRLLSGMCALQEFPISFDGDDSLRTRQMATLLSAFEMLGAKTDSANGKCPFTLHGPVRGGHCFVDGSSSQFLSSLLLSLPLAEGDSVIDLEFLNEQPYVGITTSWMDFLGLRYKHSADLLHWEIPGGQKVAAFDRAVAADFSTAAFPLIAGMIAGGEIEIRNLDFSDPQGDKKVFEFAAQLGGDIRRGDPLTVRGGKKLTGVEIDLNSTPDALPILAVAGAFASGVTRLVNVPQARIKETDRISVMACELGKLGVKAEELPDGLIIYGGNGISGGEVNSYHDHRVAMAFTIAGLASENGVIVNDAECAAVSYPNFFADFKALGAKITEL